MFSVIDSDARSSSRVTGSVGTFSMIVPNRRVVAKMSGSYIGDSRIVFA